MLKSPLLLAISILISLLSWTGTAKAADNTLGLSFELPATEQPMLAAKPTERNLSLATAVEKGAVEKGEAKLKSLDKPLDRSLEKLTRPQESLPPISEPVTEASVVKPSVETAVQTTADVVPHEQDIGVRFLKDSLQLPNQPQNERTAELPSSTAPSPSLGLDDWIFEGGSQSLVAHTVGSAEGTRHWDGARTRAYYGHQDPGNGVWNLGTFSYQHEASSPEDADEKQIKRLKHQGFQLEEQAAQQGIKLSLVQKLNGLDLANQAPLAALGEGGYIERLAQAQRLALKEEEAIAWARTRSYLDPNTQSWNAPGLGNNLYSISQDQERRMLAIDKALRAYNQNGTTGLALADLKNIHLEPSESPVKERSSTLENASEVTFVLPPMANAAPVEEKVLAAIAPVVQASDNTESVTFEPTDAELLAPEPLTAESISSESVEPILAESEAASTDEELASAESTSADSNGMSNPTEASAHTLIPGDTAGSEVAEQDQVAAQKGEVAIADPVPDQPSVSDRLSLSDHLSDSASSDSASSDSDSGNSDSSELHGELQASNLPPSASDEPPSHKAP